MRLELLLLLLLLLLLFADDNVGVMPLDVTDDDELKVEVPIGATDVAGVVVDVDFSSGATGS